MANTQSIKPTNVLFLTTYTGIGGGESLQLNLMRVLDKERYKLHLLTPRPGAFPDTAASLGVETHVIPFRGTTTFFVPEIWQHFPIKGKLAAFLRDHKIDAVLSDYHSLPFIVPAAKWRNIPVIWNAMGWWFPIHPWQRNFFANQINKIIAITGAVKERLLGTPPVIPSDKIEVIIPGVDPDVHKPGIDPMIVRNKIGIGPERERSRILP
jgi:glycosyltransferase involved in cell wall biosynthesis